MKLRKPDNFGVSVTTTSAVVLASNPLRKHVTIINSSDTNIWLGFGQAAVVGQGIFLEANGGAYEIDGHNLYTGAIYGIHAGVGSKSCVGLELS